MTKQDSSPMLPVLTGSLFGLHAFFMLAMNASFSLSNIITLFPVALIMGSVFGKKKDLLLVLGLGINLLINLQGFGVLSLLSIMARLGYIFLACVFVFEALEKHHPIAKKFWYAPAALQALVFIIRTVTLLLRGIIPDPISLFLSIISIVAFIMLSRWLVIDSCPIEKFHKPTSFQELFKSQTFKRFVALLLIVVLVVGLFAILGSGSGAGGNNDTCKFCGRSFTDSANKRSISSTGMCSNCMGNYQWGQSATD